MNATPRELISIPQLLRDIGIHYINFTTNKVISILQSIQTTMTEIPVQNFQPQVPDTTAGPHEHTYIPRADGAIIVNGVVYVRETKTPIPVVPTPAMPSAQSPNLQQFYAFAASSTSKLFSIHFTIAQVACEICPLQQHSLSCLHY